MGLNSYVTFKENIPTGCKSVSISNYTIKIDDSLGEEWLQEKMEAGISGT
jgi:hypothetical protein